mgnify:CR=1 FL=1
MGLNNFKFRRGFKSDAEKKSTFYRNALKLNSHSPLPAKQLAEYLKIEVISPSKIIGMTDHLLNNINHSKEWSAVTIQIDEINLLLIHNEKNSLYRQESDIMHELAHVISGHAFDGIQLNESSIILRNYNKSIEKEAEWLGACLQLNRESLLWALRKRMDINAISEHFCASKDMVTFRLNATGVTRQYPYFNPFLIF